MAQFPAAGGIARPVGEAVALVVAISRVDTAWRRNHRYRFMTWWLARALLGLVMFGAVLKAILNA